MGCVRHPPYSVRHDSTAGPMVSLGKPCGVGNIPHGHIPAMHHQGHPIYRLYTHSHTRGARACYGCNHRYHGVRRKAHTTLRNRYRTDNSSSHPGRGRRFRGQTSHAAPQTLPPHRTPEVIREYVDSVEYSNQITLTIFQ